MTAPTGAVVQTETTRLRLDVAYDGTDFGGWAVQPGYRTVQGELEHWTQTVLRLDSPVTVMCAGRTDAGVHARAQVAHLDLPTGTDPALLAQRLRRVLAPDIAVIDLAVAPPGFHARFSALWRRYVYRLNDGEGQVDPLQRGHVATIRKVLDVERFNQAATTLLGLHDFAPFCRRKVGATTIRTLLDLRAVRRPAGPLASQVEVTMRADAFCHSMVRSLMGALTAVATGQRDEAWLHRVATSGRRNHQVQVMPARGLTLEEIRYPPPAALATRAAEARVRRRPEELDPGQDGQHEEEHE